MKLILIRHGQTPSNVLGLLDTELPGPGLTELGFAQAAKVVERLAGESIDRIYCSAALRAQLTAAPLAADRHLEVHLRPDLKEVAAGDWEMKGDDETVRGYLGTLHRWMAGELALRTPGRNGESGFDILRRVDTVVSQAAEDSTLGTVVLVAHGALLRTWALVRAGNLTAEFTKSASLGNTGIVHLTGDPVSGWVAQSWMDADVAGSGPTGTDDSPDPGVSGVPGLEQVGRADQ